MYQPRTLSCLHTYCTGCLELLRTNDGANAKAAAVTKMGTILCPECNRYSLVPPGGGQDIPLDGVLLMVVNESNSDDSQILCTGCTAQEKALARCGDCSNFLCLRCVTDHQFVRCFRNHKVNINVIITNLLSQLYCAILIHLFHLLE